MAYQDGDTLCRAVMSSTTGLVEDEIVNTFAFRRSTTPDATAMTNLVDIVSDFYRDDFGVAGQAAGTYISNYVNRAATHRLEFYKIQAGALGSPFHEVAWLGPPTAREAAGMEPSVACVLSFHGDLTGVAEEAGPVHPKARKRGRIFWGPLTLNAIDTGTPPYRLFPSGVCASLRRAATGTIARGDTDGWFWSVWSRKNNDLSIVTGGWTDDAPDNQRRRGPGPSGRVVYGS